MNKRNVVTALAIVLAVGIIGSFSLTAAELNVPKDYGSIQAAVNAASSGDTILIAEGSYDGGFTIKKDGLTFKSTGKVENTVVSGTVNITGANGTTIDGLTITGSGDGIRARGDLTGSKPSLVVMNTSITGNYGTGIDLSHGITYAGVTLKNNKINKNGSDGVNLSGVGDDVAISDNEINTNGTLEATGVGVRVGSGVRGVVIENNTMKANSFANIHPG